MTIQDRIKEAMGKYPPARFAREFGYHHQTVYKWLKPGAEPSLKFVCNVGEKFGVSLDWLINGEGPKGAAEAARRPGSKLVRIREVAGGRVLGPAKDAAAGRTAEEEALYAAIERGGSDLADLLWALIDLKLKDPDGFSVVRSMVEALLKKGEEGGR